MGIGAPSEYGVGEYGGLQAPSRMVDHAIPWTFAPEGRALNAEPLLRRVGDKRVVVIAVKDDLGRACDLTAVSKITLTLTPEGAPVLGWIVAILEAALAPFVGAKEAVEDALEALSTAEIVVDIPIAGIVEPAKDGILVWTPTTEMDAPISAEARLAFETTGAPNAVLPSPAPQRFIVRK